MNQITITGKLSAFVPSSGEGQSQVTSNVTITERRFNEGKEMFVKHLVIVPAYKETWVKKCVEKEWTVMAQGKDPAPLLGEDWLQDGYMFWFSLTELSIP